MRNGIIYKSDGDMLIDIYRKVDIFTGLVNFYWLNRKRGRLCYRKVRGINSLEFVKECGHEVATDIEYNFRRSEEIRKAYKRLKEGEKDALDGKLF